MPGLYTEPTARAQPTHDPACAGLIGELYKLYTHAAVITGRQPGTPEGTLP